MKTQITFVGEQISMTHKEIAELVNSRPDNVKRTIERLAESGVIQLPPMEVCGRINGLGKEQKESVYRFEGERGKRDSIVVVAQLSPEFTAQLVDHWQELEEMVQSLGHSGSQPAPQPTSANENILSLARVVAEATASATMKALMEVTGIQALTGAQELPHIEEPSRVQELAQPEAEEPEIHDYPLDPSYEFIPIVRIAWNTTFSDAACRRLIDFAGLPVRKLQGVRGLCVHMESFLDALKELIAESTPPTGKLKRWQHPEFGGFTLRKDPTEIFGEAE